MAKLLDQWDPILDHQSPLLYSTLRKVAAEYQSKEVFPESKKVFRMFRELAPQDTKVCFLGQDPYCQLSKSTGECYANGIAFSVDAGVTDLPFSLREIIEKASQISKDADTLVTVINPTLSNWISQGVFLLNCSLTVEKHNPKSYIDIWRDYISGVLKAMNGLNIIIVAFGTCAHNLCVYSNVPFIKVIHPAARKRNPHMEMIFPAEEINLRLSQLNHKQIIF